MGEDSEEEERPSLGLHQHAIENSSPVAVPNPARDVVSVRLPSGFTVGALRVYDAYGRLVIEQAVPQGAKAVGLNCGTLPSGLYRVALFDFNARSVVSCPLSLIP